MCELIMAGSCRQYNNKMIIFNSGNGNPNYVFTLCAKDNKRSKINFGFNDWQKRNEILNKVKKYIDLHHDEILECHKDCPGYHICRKNK